MQFNFNFNFNFLVNPIYRAKMVIYVTDALLCGRGGSAVGVQFIIRGLALINWGTCGTYEGTSMHS